MKYGSAFRSDFVMFFQSVIHWELEYIGLLEGNVSEIVSSLPSFFASSKICIFFCGSETKSRLMNSSLCNHMPNRCCAAAKSDCGVCVCVCDRMSVFFYYGLPHWLVFVDDNCPAPQMLIMAQCQTNRHSVYLVEDV